MVTGAGGALGGLVARHLVVVRGVRDLVLVSRRAGTGLVEELEGLGASVRWVVCDVTDRDALEGVVSGIVREGGLAGVVHAAGVVDDGVLESLTPERVTGVLRPKADAAWYLHELTAGLDLSFFVLFSSAAGVLGSAGQANYAAANAFLDALASMRHAQGLPATSIAWGPWADGGMADDEMAAELSRRGLPAMAPDAAVTAIGQALALDEPCVTVADVDWARFVPPFTAQRPSPLLGELPENRQLAETAVATKSAGAESALRGRLAVLTGTEQLRLLLGIVRAQAAVVLGHNGAGAIGETATFRELGFDSLTAVEFRNALVGETGLSLPATLVFD
ncbi:beta-ketoacyl reductase, partial [Streptomyces mirabilis]